MALSAAQEDNRQVLQQWLGQFNLSSLGPDVLNYIVDNRSPEYIKLRILEHPTFQAEFPEYKAAIQAGTPMSPAEIMSYREHVTSLFKDYGLPNGFYDGKDDFADLISKRLSPQELETRVTQGYTRVAGAPQEVKDVFNQYFGVKGDAMLATFYLDPERGAKFLSDAATQAEIGGAASQYGFGFNQAQAQRYQELGITGERARQAMQQAYELNPLADESISEGEDIEKNTLAEATLTGGAAAEQVQKRQRERSAAFGGGGGGANSGREGLGLGAAR